MTVNDVLVVIMAAAGLLSPTMHRYKLVVYLRKCTSRHQFSHTNGNSSISYNSTFSGGTNCVTEYAFLKHVFAINIVLSIPGLRFYLIIISHRSRPSFACHLKLVILQELNISLL